MSDVSEGTGGRSAAVAIYREAHDFTLMRSKAAMRARRFVLRGDLDVDARRAFVTETSVAIQAAATAGTEVELDCSAVGALGPVDDAVVGMLVMLARTSQRHGARVELLRAPVPMRAQLEAAGVAHFFDWRE
jgi:ABC-type transporter Mla MlaB component